LYKLLDLKESDLPESKTIELITLMEDVKEKLQTKINEFSYVDIFVKDGEEEGQ
jgi:hypothetical protein